MNKKDYVSQMINLNKIDICCLQEIELSPDCDHKLLSFNGYSLLAELNDVKSRAGIYVKNGIDYVRRADLELRNNGMIILDINMKSKYRLINLYRSFNPTDGCSQRDFFVNQLQMIKPALVRSEDQIPIVLGDFNLDENKKYKTIDQIDQNTIF